MGFDPWNCSLKIRKSTWTPIPNMRILLGVWGFIPSHSPTLSGAWDATPELLSWPTLFASPCFGCEPKARVTTKKLLNLRMPQFFCYGRQKILALQQRVPKAQVLFIVEVVTFTLNPMMLVCVYVKAKMFFTLVLWTWTFVTEICR
jgi:hypothetical protein